MREKENGNIGSTLETLWRLHEFLIRKQQCLNVKMNITRMRIWINCFFSFVFFFLLQNFCLMPSRVTVQNAAPLRSATQRKSSIS